MGKVRHFCSAHRHNPQVRQGFGGLHGPGIPATRRRSARSGGKEHKSDEAIRHDDFGNAGAQDEFATFEPLKPLARSRIASLLGELRVWLGRSDLW